MKFDFDIHVGKVRDKPVDWRKRMKDGDKPDDDAPRPTDPDVIAMLGFDPMEEFSEEEGGRRKGVKKKRRSEK